MTIQEHIFLERVALKMANGLTLEQAGESVLADDRRIVKKALAINDAHRMAFNTLSASVYAAILARKVSA